MRLPFTTPKTASEPSTNTGPIRGRRRKPRPVRTSVVAAGAVVAVGALVGTGFVVQTTVVTEQNERVAATSAHTEASGLRAEQLAAYGGVLTVRATRDAQNVLTLAQSTLEAASGKVDASALDASVASLAMHDLLAPQRVFSLVSATEAEIARVAAATEEADRIAAEQAAAEEAARLAAEAAAQAQEQSYASSSPRPSAPSNPSEAQAIARDMISARYGWGEDQFGCLVALWNRESGWNANAYNASSGATGIPQALPGNKMASHGDDWQTNPATQISWGIDYIAGRYGSPCGAWEHSEARGWY